MSTVKSAIGLIGLSKIARRAGCYPSAVQKWRDEGRLPQSELAGLTQYAEAIAELSKTTDSPVTVTELLADTRAAWEARPSRRAAKIRGRRIEASQ